MSEVSQPNGAMAHGTLPGMRELINLLEENERISKENEKLKGDCYNLKESMNQWNEEATVQIRLLQQTREENKRLLQRIAELEERRGDYFDR